MKASPCTATPKPVRGWPALFAGVAVGVLSAAPALAYLTNRASRAEERAGRDPLTGISNRGTVLRAFRDRVADGHPPAVLFLDLDRFKEINDRYGHLAGDNVIRTVATRLHQWARRRDGLVGRLGGDEFILLTHDTSLTGAVGAARQARQIIADPITVYNDHRRMMITPSATVGVALAAHDRDWTDALRAADIALYHAKRADTGYAVFEPTMVVSPQPRPVRPGPQRESIETGR